MSILTDVTLQPRSTDYEQLPPLPFWKKNLNASFLNRVKSASEVYEAYVKAMNANLQRMLKHIDTKNFKIIDLLNQQKNYADLQETKNENLTKLYDQSQTYINQLKSQLAIAQVNAQTPAAPQFFSFHRSLKAPEPPEFTSEDKFLIRSFIFIARNKITANRNHFELGSEVKTQLFMIVYIFSRFRGTAAKRALVLIFNDQFIIADNFFQWIERVFENPDSVATAQVKIKECKQKNKPFQKYFAEFFMYINDIGYNETVQKIVFYDDLFIKIKQYLIIVPWRNIDFVVFQKECDRLKNVYKSISIYTPRNKETTNTQRNSTPIFTAFASTNNHNHFHFSIADENSMNLSVNRVKRDSLIEAEKQQRRENGLCLYCGEPDHLIRNCPRKSTFRSVSFGSTFSISSQPASVLDTPASVNKMQKNA